jgi:hypothetical protein
MRIFTHRFPSSIVRPYFSKPSAAKAFSAFSIELTAQPICSNSKSSLRQFASVRHAAFHYSPYQLYL